MYKFTGYILRYDFVFLDAVSLTTSKKITGTKTVVNGLTVQNLGATNASFQTVLDTNDQVFPLTSTLEGLVKYVFCMFYF